MAARSRVYQVAVPAPLYRHFDYLAPLHDQPPKPGARVRVPFGPRRSMVGVVIGVAETSALPKKKLKRIAQVLDAAPILPAPVQKLLLWAAGYYHHPLGEVVFAALPALLRAGRPAEAGVTVWRITPEGEQALVRPARAPARRRLLEALRAAPEGLEAQALAGVCARAAQTLRALRDRGWASTYRRDCLAAPAGEPAEAQVLNPTQRVAVEAIARTTGGYQCFLLHGVTGSGKTEVYLGAIEGALARGGQALVLVPEIGLTPQLVARFRRRFHVPIAVLHSGLGDPERLCAWLAAGRGLAPIVLGTRSAVFTPLKSLGLIVVDEEHDVSYKQQEGFRYSARDLAILRAAREKVPVVLGSATPSLESLNQVRRGAYRLLELPERTGHAGFPQVHLIDMRRQPRRDGLSPPLLEQVRERLGRGEQSLLFLNRRGFAPVWMCHDCGWIAPCSRCDTHLTLHQRSHRLRCHHCGAERAVIEPCPACGGAHLRPLGEGTERVEAALQHLFSAARVERIDRDSTRRKGALEEKLRRVHEGAADLLVGTQMLAKGHDFPNVTLVGVLNADQGLYGSDFRAPERLFQQILQVAGRAGRAHKPGLVLIQTWHPDHPIFDAIRRHDFSGFADYALAERRESEYPPFSHLALLRAESPKPGAALEFLRAARTLAQRLRPDETVRITDPLPAPMERRAGRHRAQLLVQSAQRRPLHALLDEWVRALAESKAARAVRWSLDVDPVDMY